MTVACDGQPSRRLLWAAQDYADVEQDTNQLLMECGLSPRPAGRLWLLRPPQAFATMHAVVGFMLAGARDAGPPIMASRDLVVHVTNHLDRLG